MVKGKAEPKVELPEGAAQEEQENSVAEAVQQQGRVRFKGNWQKMSREMILRHSHAGNLIGHDHKTDEVILKDPKFNPPAISKEHLAKPGDAFKVVEA